MLGFSFTLLLLPLLADMLRTSSVIYLARVKQGLIQGIKEKSVNGKDFYSYMSIPFAEPPIKSLRFKDPVPKAPWQGTIIDGTKMPSPCMEYKMLDLLKETKTFADELGNEDCLYLNVFTPKPNSRNAGLPVMVFIHGGGFFSGAASDYPPYVLMDEDIVFVSIQYRLGIFGFFSTEDSVIPGNMGLKDQQLALKWVQENIRDFGGNPDCVTLFGESAGGGSVHLQMLSPGSKDLFQRVIIQSGSALCSRCTGRNHNKFALKVGEKYGCLASFGSESFLECVQNINSSELLLYTAENVVWGMQPLPLTRVDGDFLPDTPENLMIQGKYNKVDVMSGITRNEGAFVNLWMFVNPLLREKLNTQFDRVGPFSVNVFDEENPVELARQIYQHYLQRQDISIITNEDDLKLEKLYSQSYFDLCHKVSGLFWASDKNISLHLYQLDHYGQNSLLNKPGLNRNNWIAHFDDMYYLFAGGPIFSKPLEDPNDLLIRALMVKMWTNFSKTGDPTPPGSPFLWEKATEKNLQRLSITTNPKMEKAEFQKDIQTWLSFDTKQNAILKQDRRINPSYNNEPRRE